MKILFVRHTTLGAPGAMDAHALPVALSRLGHAVSVVAFAGGDSHMLREAGVEVIEVHNRGSWLPTLFSLVRKKSPHIVHVFIHAGCGLYPFILAPFSRAKFVLDIRSPLLSAGLRRLIVRLKNQFEPLGYDCITAHSIGSAWTVVGPRKDIYCVPPGVHLDMFPRRDDKQVLPSSPSVRAIYIGSLNKTRQIPKLIKALSQELQEGQLVLDIYGDGNDRETITRLVNQYGLAAKIRLLGTLPREKLYSRMVGYDIGIAYVPRGTVYDPAPPLKTMEYLAAGLATIATDTPGNASIIRDGKNGMLVGGSPKDFAQSLVRLASDVELQQGFRSIARSSVESFDWRRIVQERLIPVYESLFIHSSR